MDFYPKWHEGPGIWVWLVDAQLFCQCLPFAVDQDLCLGIHDNFIGPRAREALAGPLARGIDAHFRPEVWQPAGMVERIDRTEGELDVALRIDVVEDLQCHIGQILHVNIFIHDDDALREHGLSERPDGIHHFARLTGVRLLDRDDHQVMEDAFDRQIDVDQLRDGQLHQRQENTLDRLAHVGIFLRRLADDGSRVNGIFAVRDAGDVEDRIEIFKRIETGMVAERSFGTKFIEMYVPFEHDFTGCRNFEIDGLTLDEINGGAAQKTGDEILLDLWGSRNDGRKSHSRVGADGHGDFHLSRGPLAFGQYAAARTARHDVHGCRFSVN